MPHMDVQMPRRPRQTTRTKCQFREFDQQLRMAESGLSQEGATERPDPERSEGPTPRIIVGSPP